MKNIFNQINNSNFAIASQIFLASVGVVFFDKVCIAFLHGVWKATRQTNAVVINELQR